MVCSIGGIVNLTVLLSQTSGTRDTVLGFDYGLGSASMDYQAHMHRDSSYDADGTWARSGRAGEVLFEHPEAEPSLAVSPSRSIGHGLSNPARLQQAFDDALNIARPEDVQATLFALAANTITDAIRAHVP